MTSCVSVKTRHTRICDMLNDDRLGIIEGGNIALIL